jgi:hypothetical protein
MAFTKSNIKRTVVGDLNMYAGTFTSASGDTTLTISHGYNIIWDTDIALNLIGAQTPTVSTTSGVTTVVWDDTKGASGVYTVIGK